MWKSLPVPWSRYDRAWPGPRCILLPRLNLNGLIAVLSPKGGGQWREGDGGGGRGRGGRCEPATSGAKVRIVGGSGGGGTPMTSGFRRLPGRW
jgi:hypothetical protein